MLVSIITPMYNSAEFISETIQSVQIQTLPDWEMLIVDDCSTDNSVKVVDSIADDEPRISLIQLDKNSGAAVARNRAIDASKGRYIAFLDSDDLWLPDKLEKQLAFMEEKECPFSYGAYEKIDEMGNIINHVGVPQKISYIELLKTNSIGCLTVVYDTKYFGKMMMPLIRRRQDFALWLQLLKQVSFAYGLRETLGQYRVRTNSISANKVNTATYTWHLYREIEKFPLLKASYYFMHYAIRGVIRTKLPSLAKKLGILG